jgi:Protein of unknown function (DUF2950)
MKMKNDSNNKTAGGRLAILFWLTALVASFALLPIQQLAAQHQSQRTFKSPGEAAMAMFTAAKAGDHNELMQIFGPDAKDLLSSGDAVADKNEREQIVKKYEQMHRLVTEPDKTVVLYLGAENWPFPIPLVEKNNTWFFDTASGKKEVLYRRIGRNESFTIGTLEALVDAQKEYASQPRDSSNVKQYAQKFMSDEGKHNGLFWKAPAGQTQSPIGPLVANAAHQGYEKKGVSPIPFHGYIYRILESQGKDAAGGAMSYMTDGKMTRGFAFVAYPAEYRNSGVMTFIVGQDGRVYQKDLGPRTATIAANMKDYNPDKSWFQAE